jgi:hypothetical protein
VKASGLPFVPMTSRHTSKRMAGRPEKQPVHAIPVIHVLHAICTLQPDSRRTFATAENPCYGVRTVQPGKAMTVKAIRGSLQRPPLSFLYRSTNKSLSPFRNILAGCGAGNEAPPLNDGRAAPWRHSLSPFPVMLLAVLLGLAAGHLIGDLARRGQGLFSRRLHRRRESREQV